MSHFQLGHADEALKFRAQFDEAMQHEKFNDDPECQSFGQEVEALFAKVPEAQR